MLIPTEYDSRIIVRRSGLKKRMENDGTAEKTEAILRMSGCFLMPETGIGGTTLMDQAIW